jgi:serine/threonine-protein kinase
MTCNFSNEDCHYLAVQGTTLYEVYGANKSGSNLQAQCLARWELGAIYPPEGRGDHCTSADAAGFPMAPLLFNADEVYAATQVENGDIGHAIRFVMPNDKMASDLALEPDNAGKLYVRPATHAGGPKGLPGYIPYGSRLRLRADFPLANYNPAAQVILRTLKRYGMVLADGGGVALTGEADTYTTKKWADLGINGDGSRVFDQTANAQAVAITDFEIIDTGDRIAETYDCVRAAAPSPILFANGFE